ncbi:NAD-dependent epimerase/dehydratase family protein [Streptomyces sp. B21-106]|uniref:NAD-dependent epimerase/dehydratase family protein n=1 Tax=Streptomyces sp. B21-106 TaxID=3039418 RepID=UPI002FEEFCE9
MSVYGVTGGAGFIGGHVVDEIHARGHEAIIFDHAGRTHARAEVFLGDVRDPVAMTELAAHVDGIIHLAACLGTQETIQNPRPAAETNVQGGLNFLEAIAQYKIPGVYIGVGNHWMQNTYSISKTTVERFVAMFNKERGTRCNIVRLVNAYGPRQSVAPPFGPAKVRKITPSFVCRALTGEPIEIYGDGQQVSDMVHVTDGAKALVTALEKAAAGIVFDKAVEVGPADHRTVNEVAELVIKAAVDLGYDAVPLTNLPMRPGEIPGAQVTADTSTLPLVDMGADTLVDLETGIAEVVTWYAENWLPTYKTA